MEPSTAPLQSRTLPTLPSTSYHVASSLVRAAHIVSSKYFQTQLNYRKNTGRWINKRTDILSLSELLRHIILSAGEPLVDIKES